MDEKNEDCATTTTFRYRLGNGLMGRSYPISDPSLPATIDDLCSAIVSASWPSNGRTSTQAPPTKHLLPQSPLPRINIFPPVASNQGDQIVSVLPVQGTERDLLGNVSVDRRTTHRQRTWRRIRHASQTNRVRLREVPPDQVSSVTPPRGFPVLALREGKVSNLIPIPSQLKEISMASISALGSSIGHEKTRNNESNRLWCDSLNRFFKMKLRSVDNEAILDQPRTTSTPQRLLLECLSQSERRSSRIHIKRLEFYQPLCYISPQSIAFSLSRRLNPSQIHSTATYQDPNHNQHLAPVSSTSPSFPTFTTVPSVLANFVLHPSGDRSSPPGPAELLDRLRWIEVLFHQIRHLSKDTSTVSAESRDRNTIDNASEISIFARLEPRLMSDILLNWWYSIESENHTIQLTKGEVQKLVLFLVNSSTTSSNHQVRIFNRNDVQFNIALI